MTVRSKKPTAEQLSLLRSSREILEEHRGTQNVFDGLHQELNNVERMVGDFSALKDEDGSLPSSWRLKKCREIFLELID